MVYYRAFTHQERRQFDGTETRFAALEAILDRLREYRGSMVWVSVKGVQYLAQSYYETNGVRKQRSLGVRTFETEEIKSEFAKNRKEIRNRHEEIEASLSRQARFNKAAGLGRMPMQAAAILRELEAQKLMGTQFRVIGFNAILAYEAKGRHFVDPDGARAVLAECGRHLWLLSAQYWPEKAILALLRNVDRTFQKAKGRYRFVNSKGFFVEFELATLMTTERRSRWLDMGEMNPDRLTWMEAAPSFEAIVVDQRGFPLRCVAIDPRIWVAHWIWLRSQKRDAKLADLGYAVASLAVTCFPDLAFTKEALPMLSGELLELTINPLLTASTILDGILTSNDWWPPEPKRTRSQWKKLYVGDPPDTGRARRTLDR